MLTTIISYNHKALDWNLNSPYLKKLHSNELNIYLPLADKVLGAVKIFDNQIKVSYSSELLLEEYMIIHDVITHIQKVFKGKVDDSNSFLGYLSDGKPAYIMTNWTTWLEHIHRSMKHCQ